MRCSHGASVFSAPFCLSDLLISPLLPSTRCISYRAAYFGDMMASAIVMTVDTGAVGNSAPEGNAH